MADLTRSTKPQKPGKVKATGGTAHCVPVWQPRHAFAIVICDQAYTP